MLLFIIGPSASGKGTQAELLAKKFNDIHISVGDLLRDEVRKGTEMGKNIDKIMLEGKFVPGDITFKILNEGLHNAFKEYGGAVLDGFPRLYSQAIEIEPIVQEYIKDYGSKFRVIHYVLSYEECLKRQNARIKAGGARSDDRSLKERYDAYAAEIDQIRDYYTSSGVLIEIDAKPSIEDIFDETILKLDESLDKNG